MRGIMGVGTNRINKYTLGKSTQGLTHFLKKKYPNEQIKVVIAYDCRHQSKSLAKVVADVFTANGIYCYLFSDLRPTPELSFAVRHLNAHCGIVLTASHNPPEYNGYKVYGKEGGQLVPPEDKAVIQEIEKTTYDQIQFKGNATFIHYVDEKIDNVYQEVVLQEAKMELEDRSALHNCLYPHSWNFNHGYTPGIEKSRLSKCTYRQGTGNARWRFFLRYFLPILKSPRP